MPRAECLNFTLVNTGTANAVATWEDEQGRGSSWTVPPGGAFGPFQDYFRNPSVSGAGATVQGGWAYPPSVIDPKSLTIVGSNGATLPQQIQKVNLAAGTLFINAQPPTDSRWVITGIQLVLVLDVGATATVTGMSIEQVVAGAGSLVFTEEFAVGSLSDSLTAGQSESLNLCQKDATGSFSGATIDHFLGALDFPLDVNYNTALQGSVALNAGTGTGTLYLTGFGYQEPL
jgi:hypothetical protein